MAEEEYVGCFTDNSGNRDLPISTAALTASDSQTALDDCAAQCTGYHYMGLQWQSECYWWVLSSNALSNYSLHDCSDLMRVCVPVAIRTATKEQLNHVQTIVVFEVAAEHVGVATPSIVGPVVSPCTFNMGSVTVP